MIDPSAWAPGRSPGTCLLLAAPAGVSSPADQFFEHSPAPRNLPDARIGLAHRLARFRLRHQGPADRRRQKRALQFRLHLQKYLAQLNRRYKISTSQSENTVPPFVKL